MGPHTYFWVWTTRGEMGLGVLSDKHLEHVPGTSLLSESGSLGADTEAYLGIDRRLLKHDKSGKIVLVPQVRLSPNDEKLTFSHQIHRMTL